MSCAICLEDLLHDHAALSCGHVFHYGCIEQLLTRYGRCALCRVRSRRIIPLFIDGISLSPASPSTSVESGESVILEGNTATEGGTAILESHSDEETDARQREPSSNLHARSDVLHQRLGVAERKISQMRQLLHQTKTELRDLKRQHEQEELQNLQSRQIALVSYRQYNTIAKEKLSLRKEATEIVNRMLALVVSEPRPENLRKMREELNALHKLIHRSTSSSPAANGDANSRSSLSPSTITSTEERE